MTKTQQLNTDDYLKPHNPPVDSGGKSSIHTNALLIPSSIIGYKLSDLALQSVALLTADTRHTSKPERTPCSCLSSLPQVKTLRPRQAQITCHQRCPIGELWAALCLLFTGVHRPRLRPRHHLNAPCAASLHHRHERRPTPV